MFFSLKRTTDVMFGGKQVLVCGYGEVRFVFDEYIITFYSIGHWLPNTFVREKTNYSNPPCILFTFR